MSTVLVCFSCRKKYALPQAPQGVVSCKICGKPLKNISIEQQASSPNHATTQIQPATLPKSPLEQKAVLAPILEPVSEEKETSRKSSIRKPPSSLLPRQTSNSSQSLKMDSPSGFQKLQTIEELPPQQREDLHFALRLLEAQRISPSGITNALEDLKSERQKGSASINLGQFLMRQRVIEVNDFVQMMKEISTLGSEKFDIPEGYNIYLKQDQLLIQDKKMPLKVGDYQILQELGRGGMGIVYRVYHDVLAKEFALKMLLLGDRSTETMIKRFFNEAKAIARLSHSNIIAIHHIGDDHGNPYYTMEFIPGKSLADLIREQKIPLRLAVQITQKLAGALHYAHEEKIIHRDIKPQNILMREEKEPVLTDFGLAKDKATEEASLTLSGTALGTPAYMSPEQAKGQVRKIGPLSDVYSLGAVLYEMITGFPPFRAKNQQEMLHRVINEEVVSPRIINNLIPKDVENICLKALEKEPQKRYASALEFQNDLEHYLNNEPVKARPITTINRLFRKAKKHKGTTLTLSLSLFLLLLFSFIYYRLPGDLNIQTVPKDAEVFVDGVLFSNKKIQNLSPGTHQLTLKKEGYQTLETVVVVGRGTLSGYQFTLYSLYGNLIISSNPLGAQVDIFSENGEVVQQIKATPSITYLHEGKYKLRCSKPGYITQEFQTEVFGGNQNTSITLTLPSHKAELTVLCQPENIGATLEIKSVSDSETQRMSLPLLQPLPLSEGKYELFLQQRNYISQKIAMDVQLGQKIQLHAFLEPRILLEYAFPEALVTTPTVQDINDDGYPDFFVPCEDKYVYLLDGKKRQIIWSWKVEGSVYSTPVIFTPTLSSDPLVLFHSLDGYIYVLYAKTGQLKWKKKIGQASSTIYCEVGISGQDVIFCATEQNLLYCLSLEEGHEIWKYTAPSKEMGFRFKLQNITGNEQKEILIVKDRNSQPVQLDINTGKEQASFRIPRVQGALPLCFYDFDGDQTLDFLIHTETDQNLLWSPKTGKTIGVLPTHGASRVQKLQENGKPYIVQTTFKPRSLFIYNATPPFTLVHQEFIGDVMSTAPEFEDVNRDGYLDIIFESEEDRTYVYSGKDFSRLFDFYTSGMNWSRYALIDVSQGWNFRFRSGETEPILVDINQDGFRDIVVASENGTLYGVTAKENEILNLIPFQQETSFLEYVQLREEGMLFLNTGHAGALYAISGIDGRIRFKTETEKGIKKFQMHRPSEGEPQQFLIQHIEDRLELFSLPDFKVLPSLQEKSQEIPFLLDLDTEPTPDWLLLSNTKTQIIAKSGHTGKELFRTEFPREINFRFAKLWKTQAQQIELFVHDKQGYVYVVSTESGKILRQYFTFKEDYELTHFLEDLNQDQIPDLISIKHPIQLKAIDGKTEKILFNAGKNIQHSLAPVSYRGKNGIITMMASINVSPKIELSDFNQDKILDICFFNERNTLEILESEKGTLLKTIRTPKPISSNFQLADFDQDGCQDIVVGCMDQLCIFSGKTGLQIWQYNFPGRIDFVSAVLDMNGDSRLDFWIATRNQRCYQISPRIFSKTF